MEEEQKLTKKEKRALAKEEKRKEQEKEKTSGLIKKVVYVLIAAALATGVFYLFTQGGSGESNKAKDKFISYAQELNLNTEQFTTDLESEEVASRVTEDMAEGNGKSVNSTPSFFLNDQKIEKPITTYEDFKALINGVIIDSANRMEFEVGEHDRVKGNPESGIVLVEYSDFQCPACGSYYPWVKQLNQDFPNDLMIVYRHFPLTQIHPNAMLAAKAAEAAANQGKFWEMHDMLFERQQEWSNLR